MEDNRIIDLFYERSEQAIVELSKKYGAVCRKVAGNILRNDLDVEECLNDAYLGAWNAIPPERPDPLLAYICRIVRNLSVTRYHANTVETELSARELSGLLDSFLGTLDRENRIMFVRRYWYSDPVSEIAEAFHMSSNSVSARLSRIRKKLRKFLRKEGYDI